MTRQSSRLMTALASTYGISFCHIFAWYVRDMHRYATPLTASCIAMLLHLQLHASVCILRVQ